MNIEKRQIVTCMVILTLVVGGMSACKKNRLNKQTTCSEDNSTAENMFDDVFSVTYKFDDTENNAYGANTASYWPNDTSYVHNLYNCLTITKQFLDSATFERIITFDFGTTGCKSGDGRTRTGKIIAHKTGRYGIAGSIAVITADDYTVDDYGVKGTKTVTNLGKNLVNQQYYSVIISGGEVTTPDSETITWKSIHTKTWVEGASTWFFGTLSDDGTLDSLYWLGVDGIYDDVWEITGSGDGINRDGRAFEVEITAPLKVQWFQSYIEVTEGITEIQPEDLKLRTVDFGEGTCDNEATATIGENSYTFETRNY